MGYCEFFFGHTFDLVSQKSSNYACVVQLRHTPYARSYVAVLCIMPNPTPTTPTNFSEQHRNYNSNMQTVQARYINNVLYASSFFSHPHWPYKLLAVYNLLQVVATLLLVAVNTSSVQSMKFTRHLISNSSLGVTVVVLRMPSVEHYPHHHFLPRLVHGMLWY